MPEKVIFAGILQPGDDLLIRHLGEQGFYLDCQDDAFEALNHIRAGNCDALLVDRHLFGLAAEELLAEAQANSPGLPAFLLADAGRNLRPEKDLFEVLLRPFDLPLVEGQLRSAIKAAQQRNSLKPNDSRIPEIIGRSEAIKKLRKTISMVAGKSCNILITGETGTGKELVAKAIHYLSPRASLPIVSINCGAIPEHLLEDELFGHTKGAFTSAHAHRVGRFELADKSTLFLDEIGTMNQDLQVKLLRVLQEREFQRLGSNSSIKVDIRILAATNADLDMLVQEKRFRSDLYYRLNVFPIHLSPLRDRDGDIPLLVDFFLERFCRQYQTSTKHMDPAALELLEGYEWPGNIRELENIMETAVILSDEAPAIEAVHLQNLPSYFRRPREEETASMELDFNFSFPEEGVDFQEVVFQLERRLLTESLKRSGGNRSRAAAYLNLKRTTLLEKIKRLQLE